MTLSILGRLKKKVASLPIWISIPLIAICLAASPFLLYGLFVLLLLGVCLLLIGGLQLVDTWDHDRLQSEMAQAGISMPTNSEIDCTKPQPAITTTSPDGRWMISAPWTENKGYDWELKNNKTGKIYYQGYVEKDPCCWSVPARISFLWSPDSQYLAINSIEPYSEYVHVLNLNGDTPSFVRLKPGSESIADTSKIPLDRADIGQSWFSQQVRMKALAWKNGTDLALVVHQIQKQENTQPAELQIGAHLIYHFEGDAFTVTEVKRDFYEKFITDL